MYTALLMSFLYAAEERPHIEDLLEDFNRFKTRLETNHLESGGNINNDLIRVMYSCFEIVNGPMWISWANSLYTIKL